MPNLQAGSFVLNMELLVYIAAGIMGVLAVRLFQRKHEEKEKDVSLAWNAVLLWIAVWKGSLLLIDPLAVIRQPLSLVYFDGGTAGFWLASLAAVGYSWYRYSKRHSAASASGIVGVLVSGWSTVYLLAVIVLEDPVLYHHWLGIFIAGTALLLLINTAGVRERLKLQLSSGGRLQSGKLAAQGAGVLLILVLLSYTIYSQTNIRPDTSNSGGAAVGAAAVGAKEGNMAPSIALKDLSGNAVTLEQYRGQTILVNFWTTWCKVCLTEMPHVQKLYEHYRNQGEDVVILSVNVTSQELHADKVQAYVDDKELSFQVVLDTAGAAAERYRVAAYPSTFIIDSHGIIQERFLGAISFADMKKRLERVRA